MNEPEERTGWEKFWLVLLYIFAIAVASGILTGIYLLIHLNPGAWNL